MTEPAIQPEDLAARVCARVFHDIMSPVSAIRAGMSFLGDSESPETRAEGSEILRAGLRGLEERMALYRLALGRGEAAHDSDMLERHAAAQFDGLRPQLNWVVASSALPGTAARAALHLVIILGEALAAGGEARISTRSEEGKVIIRAEATGPRVRLHPETRAGLMGEPCPDGPAGRWAFAAFLRAQVQTAGGEIALDSTEARLIVEATAPSAPG